MIGTYLSLFKCLVRLITQCIHSRITNGTGSNTCPYNFICRQCYQNTPSPLLMNNLSLSTSLYISPMLLHSHTNFPRYCLHWVMFVTAKFHHRSLSKLRSKTRLCYSMSITTTPSLPCAEKFSDKGGRTPLQILEVHWRDLPLCK